jgi:release factor glutamine methyltransferase
MTAAAAAARGGTVREALGASVDALAAAGIDTPRLDAEVLLAAATGLSRAGLAAEPDAALDPAASRTFAAAVRRRLQREPVAYITGTRGFRRLELAVDRRALIPRPETELLVEMALEIGPSSVLDIGTGSGAIALAIADELPGTEVVASDTSPDALDLARENAERLGLAGRVRFELGSVPARRFGLVLANLPYVRESEWEGLPPEIRKWEPRSALVAGADGLDAIRPVIEEADGDAMALEVGLGQADEVAALLRAAGWGAVEVRPDLAGIDRVVLGRREGP